METREIYSSARNFMDGIQILTDMLCTVRTILAGENTVCSLIDGGDSSNENLAILQNKSQKAAV